MRSFTMGRRVAAAGAALALGFGPATAAGKDRIGSVTREASAMAVHGRVSIYFTPEPTESLIVITGAIGDYGTGVPIDGHGHTDPAGQFERIRLQHGAFTIDNRKLNSASMHTEPTRNPRTCSLELKVEAAAALSDGSGLYRGARGSVTLSSDFAAVFPHDNGSTGPCDFDTSPLRTALRTSAQGTVSFG